VGKRFELTNPAIDVFETTAGKFLHATARLLAPAGKLEQFLYLRERHAECLGPLYKVQPPERVFAIDAIAVGKARGTWQDVMAFVIANRRGSKTRLSRNFANRQHGSHLCKISIYVPTTPYLDSAEPRKFAVE
jgi:hypothetical protein